MFEIRRGGDFLDVFLSKRNVLVLTHLGEYREQTGEDRLVQTWHQDEREFGFLGLVVSRQYV